ncbi:hypothetical protein HDR66_01265 [bacterium]|nr:hypothetical protein [bacterium]
MALKPRTRRKIIWTITGIFAGLFMAAVIIPPMITLNQLKPELAAAITAKTGVPATIRGNVHFSLLGHVTIVARDVKIPTGQIGSITMRMPLSALFSLRNATPTGRIDIYDAHVLMSRISPATIGYDVELHNVTIRFMDKDYTVISGKIGPGKFRGTVRTDQHKYDIQLSGDEFYITNKNNELVITGILGDGGGARGTMSLSTANVNRMFEFSEPVIPMPITLNMKFDWDGGYGFKFTDIRGDNFTGNITLSPDGARDIHMTSDDLEFDFSFLMSPTKIMQNTTFDLNLRGKLKIGDRTFSRLIVRASGTNNSVNIERIVADNIVLTGGTITGNGATDISVSTTFDGHNVHCMFSGTPSEWECDDFTLDKITGQIKVTNGVFNITAVSNTSMPDIETITDILGRIGRNGTVKFTFPDAAGTMVIHDGHINIGYTFARDKTLSWIGTDLNFIPAFMQNDIGDVSVDGTRTTFHPHSNEWTITTNGREFIIRGKNWQDWFPNSDMRALRDGAYSISGVRARGTISDLKIKVLGHEFTGRAVGDTITLQTETLNLDTIISQNFTDNYDEMEFLTDAPIMIPFGLGANVSLRANRMIYNGNLFQNFVYSLKSGHQSFSIADSDLGNLLVEIKRNKKEYDIFIQANKFATHGDLLKRTMPLNIIDTRITGTATLHTSGAIAHDISYNMTGDIDLQFTGGFVSGIGTDEFYASAANITSMNAEYVIARALDGGTSQIKKMHIAGRYNHGDFETGKPFELALRHADASGVLEITDGKMRATYDLILRGASPKPMTISVSVLPNGTRNYSLSEIMRDFDAGFMREFIATHQRF